MLAERACCAGNALRFPCGQKAAISAACGGSLSLAGSVSPGEGHLVSPLKTS